MRVNIVSEVLKSFVGAFLALTAFVTGCGSAEYPPTWVALGIESARCFVRLVMVLALGAFAVWSLAEMGVDVTRLFDWLAEVL